jgi:hypothetical protein
MIKNFVATPTTENTSAGGKVRTCVCFSGELSEETLFKQLLIEDRQFHDSLLQFARKEFCCETILFYDELIKYRNTSPTEKSDVFRNLYETFIKIGSIFEINLSNSVRQSVEKCAENFTLTEQVELMLDESISVMIMDIFARFELSDMYQNIKLQ